MKEHLITRSQYNGAATLSQRGWANTMNICLLIVRKLERFYFSNDEYERTKSMEKKNKKSFLKSWMQKEVSVTGVE